MGFFDRAKNKILSLTEETVGIGLEGEQEEEQKEERKPKPSKAPKPVRDKKPKPTRQPKAQPVREQAAPREENPQADEPKPKKRDTLFSGEDETDKILGFMQKKYKEKTERLAGVPTPQVQRDGSIQDILHMLDIPTTFEIGEEVYMPEDIDAIKFDLEVPQGYERAEVESFKTKAKLSIAHFVKLLRARNEHIAQLATTIDRLQVDLNNMKFQAEIAAGINIIPSDTAQDLENENAQLRLEVGELKDRLSQVLGDELVLDEGESDSEVRIRQLQDELSVLRNELKEARDENDALVNQMRALEENTTDDMPAPPKDRDEYEGGYEDSYDDDYDDDYDDAPLQDGQDSSFVIDYDEDENELEQAMLHAKEGGAGMETLEGLASIIDDADTYVGSAFSLPQDGETMSDFLASNKDAFAAPVDDDDTQGDIDKLLEEM